MGSKKIESVEPTADVRQAALGVAQLYAALMEQGFPPGQALYLTGQSIRGAMAAGGDVPTSD